MPDLELKVVVEQADIDKGVPGDSEYCAVACALSRVLPDPSVPIAVSDDRIFVEGYGDAKPSDDVSAWIAQYDADRAECGPFGFRLTLRDFDWDA